MADGRVMVWALVLSLGAMGCLGCEEQREGREKVVIKGETFWLEPATDEATRVKGLAGRETIEPDGGMVFVFPRPAQLQFVMRHCLTDIDIAFLDGTGRVLAMHEMKQEEPQREGESDMEYELRLTRYPSRFSSQFVIEVAPGTWDRLGLQEGDQVKLDTAGLKERALRSDEPGG